MPVFSLATLKKNFGFNDDVAIKYEKRDEELIIHLPIMPKYRSNDKIINQAQKVVEKRKVIGWSRQDFFNDFLKVIRSLQGKYKHPEFNSEVFAARKREEKELERRKFE